MLGNENTVEYVVKYLVPIKHKLWTEYKILKNWPYYYIKNSLMRRNSLIIIKNDILVYKSFIVFPMYV